MSKRILVVGGVAGGASAAARARRLDEKAEIVIFERGEHVSFSNCSMPYFLSRAIADSASLVMMDPTQFKNKYNIEVRTQHEVTSIDRSKKTIQVKNLLTGAACEEPYDTLILSPGGEPVMPKAIEGINNKNVFSIRNVTDIARLDSCLRTGQVNQIAVVGGGALGCEVAENIVLAGKQVTLIEAADQILTFFDYDMAQILHKEMLDQGISLILKDGVKKIRNDSIELVSGKIVPAQAVVMAIGIRPESTLAKNAGLEIAENGCIRVNTNYQTSDPDIYAVGDVIEVFNALTHKPMPLALAFPAQLEARAAADHIYGLQNRQKGFLGSSVLRVFNLIAACTGLNLLHGVYRQVPLTQVRELVEHKACIIDVREQKEFTLGHIKNAVNIPLSELRSRISEIPKDRPVYLHCRSSQRSYNAIMALQHLGFTNLYNITGSFLALCLYEYPQDVMFAREKIVTEYNFT